ncbi:cilia- and flagella-associated protein 65 [Tachyglossus aculeatus]|uniref:cilia- and flagella-associated protein 65 n=1 Tax=Tachyglossus aculeatus TaxID=9261 RepID=UPI0018F4A855|nr:cilia- and flagella-associated protein 65 [Tachyglossus aculeatus]
MPWGCLLHSPTHNGLGLSPLSPPHSALGLSPYSLTPQCLEQSPGLLGKVCQPPAPARIYKTLPPIKNQRPSFQPASRSRGKGRREPKKEGFWVCPEPPEPFLLHLSLTARSHATDDFLAAFYPDLQHHFLSWETSKQPAWMDGPGADRGRSARPDLASAWQHKQMLTDVLTTIIRGLMDDGQFHEAVTRSLREPIPFYSQLWSEDSAWLMAEKASKGYLLDVSPLLDEREEREEEEGGEKGEEVKEEEEVQVEEEEEEKEDGAWERTSPRLNASPSSLETELLEKLKAAGLEEQQNDEKETLTRMPAFGQLVESLLENIIRNIMVEASLGEVVLTAQPRIVAPAPTQPKDEARAPSSGQSPRKPSEPFP